MSLYLTISRGPRADLASPVLASSDRVVIAAVLSAIARLDDPGGETAGVDGPTAGRRVDWRVMAGEVPDELP